MRLILTYLLTYLHAVGLPSIERQCYYYYYYYYYYYFAHWYFILRGSEINKV